MLAQPVEPRLGRGPGPVGIEVEYQGISICVFPLGIAGLGQQLAGDLNRFALCLACNFVPMVYLLIHALSTGLVAEDPRRQQILGGQPAAIEKNLDPLFYVQRYGERLSELLFILSITAHFVVQHIESEVKNRGAHCLHQAHIARPHSIR